jgi:glucose/arabinose dehydrogenase/plastocyanin
MVGVVLLFCITLTICPVQAQPQTEDVEIRDYAFQPDLITVEPGTTVVWTNYDADQHTVTSTEEIFGSGLFGEGETFEYTFTEPGTYEYFCTVHPFMEGEVVVSEEEPEPVEPGVVVTDQPITVTVDEVVSDGPGWIVIHADANATPGPVIGHSPVEDGVNENVTVEIEIENATEILHAMLHIDAGEIGIYEFPGPDVPAEVDGEVVNVPFNVTETPAEEPEQVGLDLVAEGLTSPVGLTSPDDGSGRLFVVDQAGEIRIIDENGTLLEEPFLNLTDQIVKLRPGFDERGLLGLAFHPDFTENGRFFVYYSAPLREGAPEDWNHTSRISEFNVSAEDENRADPGSERVILEVDQPQFNHDAGSIAFGPDGYLYIPLGDGGGGNDVGVGHPPEGNGQNTTTLLGSILRIDIDGEEPYGIPEDNPFVDDDEVLDEIYAYGLRNPWRMTFDAGGENYLFASDAGQEFWESVNIIEAGGNYGWNLKEGSHAFDPENATNPPEEVPEIGLRGEPLIDPIIEYPNAKQSDGLGSVVVGGYVYRGSDIPEFEGRYIFAEWNRADAEGDGIIFIATPPEDNVTEEMWEFTELEVVPNQTVGAYILAIGQDADRELYVLTTQNRGPTGETGRVYKLIPPPGEPEPVEPGVVVTDQPIVNDTVTVDEVVSDGPGWIVIHADANTTPGPVIGHSPVEDGVNENVTVEIETENATEILHAMLHVDAGEIGVYEFPGPDVPAEVDGEIVNVPFNVTEEM